MIVWISKTLALSIHERQLAEHGGSNGVRDAALLDSILARPQRLFADGDPPPDLAALAASLAYGLACDRPFLDGNKRTAHICYRVFLALNGCSLSADDEDKYIAMLGLTEGSLSEDDFAAWVRRHTALASGHRVNEPAAVYARRARLASTVSPRTTCRNTPLR